MHFSLSTEMMREVIMDHYQNPRNKREEKDPTYVSVYMDSVSCIDKIYIQMKVENDVLVDVCWHGNGCAISTASTSIMTELLVGKTVEEASKIMEHYTNMMYGKEYDPGYCLSRRREPHNPHSIYECDKCGYMELSTNDCENEDI